MPEVCVISFLLFINEPIEARTPFSHLCHKLYNIMVYIFWLTFHRLLNVCLNKFVSAVFFLFPLLPIVIPCYLSNCLATTKLYITSASPTCGIWDYRHSFCVIICFLAHFSSNVMGHNNKKKKWRNYRLIIQNVA